VTTSVTDAARPGGPASLDGAAAGSEAVPDVSTLSFDAALEELQRTVEALEEGGLPLERTIELYERGAALHARCATLLDEAELRIRRLVEGPDGRPVLVDEPAGAETWTDASDGRAEDR
jgi:exodeoxyribonuclease VII small subunit